MPLGAQTHKDILGCLGGTRMPPPTQVLYDRGGTGDQPPPTLGHPVVRHVHALPRHAAGNQVGFDRAVRDLLHAPRVRVDREDQVQKPLDQPQAPLGVGVGAVRPANFLARRGAVEVQTLASFQAAQQPQQPRVVRGALAQRGLKQQVVGKVLPVDPCGSGIVFHRQHHRDAEVFCAQREATRPAEEVCHNHRHEWRVRYKYSKEQTRCMLY